MALYRGTPTSPSPGRPGFVIAPVRNAPLLWVEVHESSAQAIAPFDLYRRKDGAIVAQNVLGRKKPLSFIAAYSVLARPVKCVEP